ncbi:hypothetical protein J6590_002559, partial [Homalodisca vitripennis]
VEELENSVNQQQSPGRATVPSTPELNHSTPAKSTSPGQQAKLEMLEERLKEKTKELQQLQEDFNTYRKERSTNERMLNESLEKARDELRALAVSKTEVVAKAELAEERFKVLKANADSYKLQIQALEKKNNNYSVTVAKYEQSISHMKDECVAANAKLSRAEVGLEHLRREYQQEVQSHRYQSDRIILGSQLIGALNTCLQYNIDNTSLLPPSHGRLHSQYSRSGGDTILKITQYKAAVKESEARLVREREATKRQASGQAMLMANLEMIKASFERTEAESKVKLEAKLEEAQKECSALRRRLQEEQDRFRERTDALERSTEAARSRLDEEKEISHQLRTQVETLRQELRVSKEAVEQLNTKVRTTSHKVVPDPETGE